MSLPRRCFLLLLGCGCLAMPSVRAEIEWRGTLVGPGGASFALTDTATGESQWVSLGGRFGGFALDAYDADRQRLALKDSSGQRHELSLAAARVVPSQDNAAPTAGLSGLPLAEGLAQQGDIELAELLRLHREAVLRVEVITRRLAEAERREKATPPSRPSAISGQAVVANAQAAAATAAVQAAPGSPANSAALRAELAEATQQATSLADQIARRADEKKNPTAKSE